MKITGNHQFGLFLAFLLIGIIVSPFFQDARIKDLVQALNFSLAIISGLLAFGGTSKRAWIISSFFVISILIAWIRYFNETNEMLRIAEVSFFILVFGMLLIQTLIFIRKSKEADLNVIFASLSGYLLIGYTGGFAATGISILYPGSYNLPGMLNGADAIYHSFVTLTTLGYGDISPVSDQARALSILLSIVGPMYVAILIAMLVGKYLARSSENKD
jgi:voltage-gated potassium channel Kch